MVFKRRTPLSLLQKVGNFLWPKTGWKRAASYVIYRVRRLPDPPYRIARGVAAGIFVSFTPFFGFHFILAGMLAFALRGNIMASLLATFVGNPLTFPLIASVSVELGGWMLGTAEPMPLYRIVSAFSSATLQLWSNLAATFTSEPTHWDRLGDLFMRIFLPYLVGGILPGLISATIGYMVTHRVITAHQRRRLRKLKKRAEKRREAKLAQDEARHAQPAEPMPGSEQA